LESYDEELEFIRRRRECNERKRDDLQKRKLDDHDIVLKHQVQQGYHERQLKELDIEYRRIKMERDEFANDVKDKIDFRVEQLSELLRKQAYSEKVFKKVLLF
jgi:hypothetical protein